MMMAKIKTIPKQKVSLEKNCSSPVKLLHEYCKNIENWPENWEISEVDLTIGQAIKEEFKLFLINRIEKGRAKRTIRFYASYLCVLGGELISRINEDDSERCLSAKKLILNYIDDSGGPYWRHAGNELEHAEYDSVCKQFYKFITAKSN